MQDARVGLAWILCIWYACFVIAGFKDDATRDVFDGTNSKAARTVPIELWPVARRKLDSLNAARDLRDLKAPPGNRLEMLKGRLAGLHSIRINDQYRIVFRFTDGKAHDVAIADYH